MSRLAARRGFNPSFDAYCTAKSLVGTSAPLLVTGVMEMDAEHGEPYLRVEVVTVRTSPARRAGTLS
ncbi:MAG: hypothetical protein HY865_24880 [Chloroflexi bacterium]|nr:hypothetical protein [Chloroflexota bacterium]